MFTDLAKDWSSGPPNDYFRFVPTVYSLSVDLQHYDINLYANDHNIIDKPLVKDENGMLFSNFPIYHLKLQKALFTLRGPTIRTDLTIPATVFRSESTMIPITVNSTDLMGFLSLPRWNTHAILSPGTRNQIAQVKHFQARISYRYFASVRPSNIDQLCIDLDVSSPRSL